MLFRSFVLFVTSLGFWLLQLVQALENVPSSNDISVLKHQANQARLKHLEHKQRSDYWFRHSLSPIAKRADNLVAKIKAAEDITVWNRYDNSSSSTFPGENFALAKPIINTTDLFQIVKQLPKGALLHAHLTAMLSLDKIFEAILSTPGMVMSSAKDLSTDANRNSTQIIFGHANTTISSDPGSIWTSSYVANTSVYVDGAANAFPGGKDAFKAYLKNKLTLGVEDAERSELGIDSIWRKFQGIFGTLSSMWTYEPLIRTFLNNLFTELADDKVRWVEIRNGGDNTVVKTGDSVTDPNPDYWYDLFQEEVAKFKANRTDFWGTRFIWTNNRAQTPGNIIEDMKRALLYKKKYPDLIAGFDLVAQEDLGRPLSDLAPELIWFRQQTENLNLTIPYFFHAGETLGDGNSTDDNLFDAEIFNTRRIGHGFSLFKHPLLMDIYKRKDIAVEVCLISNEALRLNDNVLQHPLPALIAHGVSTTLNNDDPAIEGQNSTGLSYDFYEAVQGFQNIGLAGLGYLAQNSVRYSNFEDQDDATWLADIEAGENGNGTKAGYLQEWNKEWENFCQWVITTYDAKYNNVTA